MKTLAAVLLFAPSLSAQEAGVLPVASCEQLGLREFRIAVTFYNCGAELGLDYTAFIHFDRDLEGESLYVQPGPGLRPLVAGTQSSTWGPNETVPVAFAAITVPGSVKREVFVKAGLYDAGGDTGRLPLLAGDRTHRVVVGSIIPDGDTCRWVRRAPSPAALPERIGARPRAFVRSMPEPPAVRFGEEDLGAWTIDSIEAGRADLARTREELCWSESSLKITYVGEGARSGFVLRPPGPIAIADDADVGRLWLLGRAAAWAKQRTDEQPLLRHWIEITDADGAPRRLEFRPVVGYPYWYVARARIPAAWPRPLTCTGVGFVGCTNTHPRTLLLDALVFAKERLATELTTSVDLTDLPIPTSPDGLLPDPPTAEFANRVEAAADRFRLIFASGDEGLEYVYAPLTGTFADLSVTWTDGDDAESFQPAAEGGPILRLANRTHGPGAPGVTRTLVSTNGDDSSVTTTWRCQAGGESAEYTLRLGIRARSLLIEIDATDESLTGIDSGHLTGAPGEFMPFPYWTWGIWDYGRDGGVVMTDRLFLSAYPDWYRSHATSLTFGGGLSHEPEALTGSPIAYAPGVRYEARTDGRRTPLHERYIFTVSPEVREVLPNIPHGPTPNREALGKLCHSTGGQASRLAEQLAEWRRLAAYGVTDVYIRHFDGMWSDVPQGPQEWTLTEYAAPVAGDVAVREYIAELQALGFTPVLYTNYTDLQPVAGEFDWDSIMLLPDGDVSDHCWPGSYPIKPLRAVELEARYAPRIAARFGTRGSFCDVHTAVAPWWKVDFDARLPGAAEFGTTYRCYAKLLAAERGTYGAVYSEGSMQWLYAGIASGSDAELDSRHPHLEPFLVDFDLLKIHPLEMDAGMSWIHRYVESAADAEALGGWEAAQDRFTAATLAFGHQGTFTRLSFRGYDTDIKTYYLLRPLQDLYAMRRAEEILYRDPASGEMLATSDALRSGIYRDGQVYVRYETGLQLWVNGSLKHNWPVELNGEIHVLPPSGFLAAGPDELLILSAFRDGARMDAASYGDVEFVDARGNLRTAGPFETDGAAILKQTGEQRWSLWPLGNMTRLKVTIAATDVSVRAFDEDGQPIEGVQPEADRGTVVIPVAARAFRYEITVP